MAYTVTALVNPADFLQLDARQIDYLCETSEATVVRLCQRSGYRAWRKWKKLARTYHGGHLRTARI